MERDALLIAVIKYITECDNIESDIETRTINVNNYPVDVAYVNYSNVLYIADFNDVQTASISQYYEDTISHFYDEKIEKYIILHYENKKKIFCLEVFVTKKDKKLEYDAAANLMWIDDLIQSSVNTSRLNSAIEQLEAGQGKTRELIEDEVYIMNNKKSLSKDAYDEFLEIESVVKGN